MSGSACYTTRPSKITLCMSSMLPGATIYITHRIQEMVIGIERLYRSAKYHI